MQTTVTLQNVTNISPEDIFNTFNEMYNNIELPEGELTEEDLGRMSGILGWATNNKAYLSSLYTWLDIAVRRAKQSGDKELSSEMICRRNVIQAFYDRMDDVYKVCSRQVTIYIEARKEQEEIKRQERVLTDLK